MADAATKIIGIASEIQTVFSTVKANEKQCGLLNGRVQIVSEIMNRAIKTTRDLSAFTASLDSTLLCLNNCLKFIKKFTDINLFSKVILHNSYSKKFEELNDHLQKCIGYFSFGEIINLKEKFNEADDNAAKCADEAKLLNKELRQSLLQAYKKGNKILLEEHSKEHQEHQDILDSQKQQYALSLQLMDAVMEPTNIKYGKVGDPKIWKSAENGNAYSQCLLGDLYSKEHDYAKAHKWYLKSASQGYAWAQHNLGNFYKNGTGVVKSYEVAQIWFMLVAEQTKNISAQCCALCTLGDLYCAGINGTPNLEKARELYEKAAAQKHPWAMCHFANFCYKGLGGLKDINKALEVYKEVITCETSHNSKTAKDYAQKELDEILKIGNPPLLWHAICDVGHETFVGGNVILTVAGEELVEHAQKKHNGLTVGRITPVI